MESHALDSFENGGVLMLAGMSALSAATENVQKVAVNTIAEIIVVSDKSYPNPFLDVTLDAVVIAADGEKLRVPAFWAGENRWAFRFASNKVGLFTWTLDCSDTNNSKLHGRAGTIKVVAYGGQNDLYRHGPIRVAKGGRHFEHADGTPFFWLADTWWKCLCKRMTWEGFQELTVDRVVKGFTVVQIVCGPYPDERFLDPRLANEGGMPYETRDFTVINPKYFDFADRRISHLIDAGISPAIVGAWGRSDCNSMEAIGVEGLKRHWRYLVARYGAYPVFWILAGEIPDNTKWGEGQWAEVANYLRNIDPYHRLLTCHTGQGRRGNAVDVNVIDFDMVGGNHDEKVAVQPATLAILTEAYSRNPAMPVLVGETCYEGHMQQGFGDTQRHIFWMNVLSGAAGHTYGAAGIWHVGVEDDPGHTGAWGSQYDWTTWTEGMNYSGATQLGIARKLLERYPWWRFEPHPEWAPGCLAAGIPGEVCFVYLPRRDIYTWDGPEIRGLDPDLEWHVYYFDPATGRKFDQGTTKAVAKDKSDPGVLFKKNVPSPQDWVLVLERAK